MLLTSLLRLFFRWLYHPFAFTYDLVAAVVSLGHWREWTTSVLPYVRGDRVLELGHGPGHLQLRLRSASRQVFGLDESRQMGRLAAGRLRRSGIPGLNLARGFAQALPFRDGCFDTILSTFPSEYIFDPRTLSEARRLLAADGRLVLLPLVWPRSRLLGWLFKITGETPSEALEVVKFRFVVPLMKSGFHVETLTLEESSGTLLVIIATLEKDIPFEPTP